MSIKMRKSERKLFLFGRYSTALLLPKKWLGELGVGPGDRVALEFDVARKRLVVRPTNLFVPTTTPKTSDTTKTADSRPAESKTEGDEWQDIPQL